jgi:hypothetical protein
MSTPGAVSRQTAAAEAIRQAQERIEALEALVAQLQDRQNNPAELPESRESSTSATANPNSDIPDAKVKLPEPFTGKSSEYESFMAQCNLLFAACPKQYCDNERKVLLVLSLLRGTAFSGFQAVAADSSHSLRKDWPAFKSSLDKIYQDRNASWKRANKLLDLRQTGSAESYAAEFQSLAASLGINDKGLCFIFHKGLKSTVKDALAPVPLALILSQLIDQAVGADQRVHQREVEERKAAKATRSQPPSSVKNSNGKRPYSESSNDKKPSGESSRPRGHISEAEKKRRRDNNLCGYCASPKHPTPNCPVAPSKPRPTNSMVTAISSENTTNLGKG